MTTLSEPEERLVEGFIRALNRGTVSMEDSLQDLRRFYREEYPEADFEKVLDQIIEELERVFDPESVEWTRAVSIISRAKSMYPHRFSFSQKSSQAQSWNDL
ncbi:MAG: hypothetical protein ABEK16_03495 [Candidatus Nanohalobium sp.]